MCKLDFKYICTKIIKHECPGEIVMTAKISKAIAEEIRRNAAYWEHFDRVIVYYDNGQIELTKILTSVFSTLYAHVEFRRVQLVDYKLFQVADMVCTMELLAEKAESNSLRNCGWLEELEIGYEEDARTAICPQVVPILQAFYSIVHPQTVTYSGKLNKAYQLLGSIATESAPYENVLKEVASAMDELNTALRNLNASIGSFIDQMTQHKTPQEVLDLFEKYEEEIVVAAYQRFKTSDNLFNYREALLEGLDNCQDVYIEALAADYCKVERCEAVEAVGAILSIIDRIRDDLTLMGELIAEIDKNHITYRQRAVQRAQFMLLTDGTTQGRINSLLRYYAQTLETPASLFDVDDSPLSKLWRIYPTEVLGRSYLKPPVTSRKPTPIEPLNQPDALDEQELRNAQQALLAYARSAVTMENVNTYAQRVLKSQAAVRASSLATEAGDDFVKIIALHTYSRSDSRS